MYPCKQGFRAFPAPPFLILPSDTTVGLCLSDILPGVPTAVQLRHPGADGALALPPGVDRHLLPPESGLGENSGGNAVKTCPSPTHQ